MDQELFNPQSSSVSSSRIIYTPSTFARTSLLHLQEVGSLQAVHPHVSKRSNLVSFLCFIVLSGEGELRYEGEEFKLHQGDCVFIDWCFRWHGGCKLFQPDVPKSRRNQSKRISETVVTQGRPCVFLKSV